MIEEILDSLWPRRCAVCQRPVDRPGRYICADCVNRVPFIEVKGCCRVCGRALEGMSFDWCCEDCSKLHPPFFDRAASAVRFEAEMRELITAFKFHQHLELTADFTDWLEGAAKARFLVREIEAIIPMPTRYYPRINKGYNPSELLAKGLAKRFDKPYSAHILARQGKFRQQAKLSEDERRENVKDTIRVRQPERVKGKCLLLIDDIMTTGSTLSEAARALKLAGAQKVWCLTLARSLHT